MMILTFRFVLAVHLIKQVSAVMRGIIFEIDKEILFRQMPEIVFRTDGVLSCSGL